MDHNVVTVLVLSSYFTENLHQLLCKPNLSKTIHVLAILSHACRCQICSFSNMCLSSSQPLNILQHSEGSGFLLNHTVHHQHQDQSYQVPGQDVKFLPGLFACQAHQLSTDKIRITTMWPLADDRIMTTNSFTSSHQAYQGLSVGYQPGEGQGVDVNGSHHLGQL